MALYPGTAAFCEFVRFSELFRINRSRHRYLPKYCAVECQRIRFIHSRHLKILQRQFNLYSKHCFGQKFFNLPKFFHPYRSFSGYRIPLSDDSRGWHPVQYCRGYYAGILRLSPNSQCRPCSRYCYRNSAHSFRSVSYGRRSGSRKLCLDFQEVSCYLPCALRRIRNLERRLGLHSRPYLYSQC